MKVKQAMHRGVNWCGINTPLIEVAQILLNLDVGAVPVSDNDQIVGIVTDRDIVCRAVAKGKTLSSMTAGDVMSRQIKFCTPEDEMEHALRRMEHAKVRRLPVLNSDKRLVGMLSMGDISHKMNSSDCAQYISAISAPH